MNAGGYKDKTPAPGMPTEPGRLPRSVRRHNESPKTRRLRRGNGKRQRRKANSEKFKGATDELADNTYDISYNRSEQYTATTKAVCEYVGINYTNGTDVRVSIEQMEKLIIPIYDVGPNATPLERRIWEKEVDGAVKRRSILEQNLKTLYSLLWGQCAPAMRAKIESLTGYESVKAASDSIGLIQGIRNIVFDVVQQNKYKPQAMHEAMRRFYKFRQDKYMENSVYLEKSKIVVEVCKAAGCDIGNFRSMRNNIVVASGDDVSTASENTLTAAEILVKEQYTAITFLMASNRIRYGKMIEDLMNKFLQKVVGNYKIY